MGLLGVAHQGWGWGLLALQEGWGWGLLALAMVSLEPCSMSHCLVV